VITLSVDSGVPGTPVTITGTGFPPGEIVALYIDAPGPYLGSPGPRADASGSFRKDIKWPGRDYDYDRTGHVNPTKPGVHTLCGDTAADAGSPPPISAKACARFQVLSPPTAAATASPTGAPISEILFAVAILAVIAVGATLWIRSTK
jgi:hypothetical protein